MSDDVVRVAALQLEIPEAERKGERLARVLSMLERLPQVDLVLLPEIWPTGYFGFETYREEAEALGGETMTAMAEAARGLGVYVLAGSMVERQGDALYNTSVMFDPTGRVLATYRKMHLFGYGSLETQLLTPGTEVVTADTAFGAVGISTCYDLRFPELYRAMVDRGAEFFLVVSAWPFPRLEHWLVLNRARAIENQAYVVACNCAGIDRGRQYLGHSMVTSPWGTVIAAADERPTVLLASLEPHQVRECREEFPPLRDRVLR